MVLDFLRANCEENGDRLFCRAGNRAYTYLAARAGALAIAGGLRELGVRAGDRIALDLPNSAGYVLLLLAGAMLDASFFLLNHRLPAAKKDELLAGHRVRMVIGPEELAALEAHTAAHAGAGARETGPAEAPVVNSPTDFVPASPGADAVFLRMFTSGSSGTPKCAELTYRNLIEAARSSASYFLDPGEGLWQLALPLYHVGGLQVMVRALVNRSAFVLYDRFDPRAVIADVRKLGATHVSVVDRMLQELLEADADAVRLYRVVHLGGGAPRRATLEAARGANVYPSYGMTEAGATVAARPLAAFMDGPGAGGMEPLDGYEVSVLDPSATGEGEIAVAGPGVFAGYATPHLAGAADAEAAGLSASPFTAGGAFRTGDVGRIEGGLLFVTERLSDMFISGGENVYPLEIEREIAAVPGVTGVAVVGVPSERWGRRPVAFVTGDASPAAIGAHLADRLAGFQRPDRVHVLAELPRTPIGKVDRPALVSLDVHRIEIVAVRIHRILQPLLSPFRTSQGEVTERESLIVEVIDHAGRTGFGEGVAFSTPWYSPETVDSTLGALTQHLVPIVLGRSYLNPAEVFASFDGLTDALMAKGALEPACWDLFGHITGRSLSALLAEHAGVEPGRDAPAGVSLGIMSIEETLAEVARYRAKGYRRVKLKIRPGDDVERVRAVREANPDLALSADANRAYSADDVEVFRQLDGLGLVCIEEPLADASIARLAAFQHEISTPICVDESVVTASDMAEVLRHPELSCINLKIGKAGGVLPSLELYRTCIARGTALWLGGMYETGVSKYLHAAFETLGGFAMPGDISESRRYFERDIVVPEVRVENGAVVLADGPGLGFDLDRQRIGEILLETIEMRRDGD